MPAAAVTPAPIAYINVVALKKLVVRLSRAPLTSAPVMLMLAVHARREPLLDPTRSMRAALLAARASYGYVPVSKSECSKQAYALHG